MFLCSPRNLGKMMNQNFDDSHFDYSNIFQRGWFNHQLANLQKKSFLVKKNIWTPADLFFFDRRLAWEAGVAMLPPPFLAGRSQGEISEDLSHAKRAPGLVGLYRG